MVLAEHDARSRLEREIEMRYLLLTYVQEDGWSKMTKAERRAHAQKMALARWAKARGDK